MVTAAQAYWLNRKRRRARNEGVGGWTPANLDPTKLKLWSPLATVLPAALDFQDSTGTTPVAVDGDPVGLVEDRTTNANDLEQATDASRPIYRGSARPSLKFSGAQSMQTAAFSGAISQPYTIASVWKFDSLTTGYTVHDGIAAGNRCSLYLNSPAVLNVYAGAAANVVGVTPDTNIHRTIIEVNGASSRIWYDGVEKSFSVSPGSHTLTGLTVGANNTGGAGYLTGSMVGNLPVVFAGQLTDSERSNLDAYLQRGALAPIFDPVFDGLPTQYGAFGLQRLRTAYNGPLLRLRRQSDDAEHDFYADHATGELSRQTVIDWAGSGVVTRVVTWYDQTGNGRHASQSTSGVQPFLDISGPDPAIYGAQAATTRLPLASSALTFARNRGALSIAAVASGEGAVAGASYDLVGVICGAGNAQFSLRAQSATPPQWSVFARRVDSAGYGLPNSLVSADNTGWKSLIGEADFANNVSAVSVDGARSPGTTDTSGNTADVDPASVPTLFATNASPGTAAFTGYCRAIALFQSSLSAGDRTAINAVLDGLKPAQSNGFLAAWGDSLTSAGYPEVLQASFDANRPCYNGGAGGETAAQVRARQVADQLYNQRINLFWVGRNGFKTVSPGDIIADIDLMIAHVVGDRWLVGSVPPSTLDSGAENTLRLALNAALEAEYGDRYVDIVAAWQAANDGSADDLSDIAAGYTPRSLRGDELHPNDDGDAVIAAAWKTAILAKGW